MPILDVAAVVFDCREAAPMAEFYQAACGGEITRMDSGVAWLVVGGITVVFREIVGYQPPSWPGADVPMRIHLDFLVEDLHEAQRFLHRHGATTPSHQPHPGKGLVMLDPDGHPFRIAPSCSAPKESKRARSSQHPAYGCLEPK